ncbi:hypothetical protein X736_16440 [Mesorhizobium sp. L2C089B000]|nr:hypothetical protein X749_17450 [Mesorhizobium sp. LNJC391B00]ESZ06169.1 hypothetical protein X736_16440 [Mesorhizobium sp. L2C089B000]
MPRSLSVYAFCIASTSSMKPSKNCISAAEYSPAMRRPPLDRMVAAPDEFLGLLARRDHDLAPVIGIRLTADEAALFQPVDQRRDRRRREICLPRYEVCRPRRP